MLDQDVSLSAGGGDQCRPRSKEGLMTRGNSRVMVIEAPNQLPEFGWVSPIFNRVQDLFPYLGGVVPDPSVDFGSDVCDSFSEIQGRELRAQLRAFPHQLLDLWSEGKVISADVARRYGPLTRRPNDPDQYIGYRIDI